MPVKRLPSNPSLDHLKHQAKDLMKGHAAGDRLLVHSVALIKQHLRPYDLVIRLGGDEFLCAMSNMTLVDAHRRFSAIAVALAGAPSAPAVRTGFAELSPEQTATELIEAVTLRLAQAPKPEPTATSPLAVASPPASVEVSPVVESSLLHPNATRGASAPQPRTRRGTRRYE